MFLMKNSVFDVENVNCSDYNGFDRRIKFQICFTDTDKELLGEIIGEDKENIEYGIAYALGNIETSEVSLEKDMVDVVYKTVDGYDLISISDKYFKCHAFDVVKNAAKEYLQLERNNNALQVLK